MDTGKTKERLPYHPPGTEATVTALLKEISLLNELISGEQDEEVEEELNRERMELIARVNGIFGTDHILKGSRIATINNS